MAEFLVSAAERERLCPLSSPDEALLVSRGDSQLGELRVGLFLSAEAIAQLGRGHREPWTARRLAGFCQAAEGVSHFLYLHHRAQASRPVSLLELEAQAELDKYLSVLLQLWASGRRAASTELRAASLATGARAPASTPRSVSATVSRACSRRRRPRMLEVLDTCSRAGSRPSCARCAGSTGWAAARSSRRSPRDWRPESTAASSGGGPGSAARRPAASRRRTCPPAPRARCDRSGPSRWPLRVSESTGGLSFASMIGRAPAISCRARLVARSTSAKRLSTSGKAIFDGDASHQDSLEDERKKDHAHYSSCRGVSRPTAVDKT